MDRFGEIRKRIGPLSAPMIAAMLLIVPATSATAQVDGPALAEGDYVVVTGESTQVGCSLGVCRSTELVSDPRVSGDLEASLDLACSVDTTCWMGGDVTISNDGGAWHGRWVGFIVEGATHDLMEWTEGAGDYEGWTYVRLISDADGDASWDVRGILYRGDLPPSVADGLLSPVTESVASE